MVFVATQPGDFSYSQTKSIHANKEIVFNQISSYNEYQNWFYSVNPKNVKLVSQKNIVWETNDFENEIKTNQLFKTDSLTQFFTFDGIDSEVKWKVNTQKDSSLVTFTINGKLPIIEKIKVLFSSNFERLIKIYQLNSLEKLAETITKQKEDFTVINNSFVSKTGFNYLAINDSVSIQDFDKIRTEHISKLKEYIVTNNLSALSTPFVLFENWNKAEGYVIFKTGIPISEEIITSSTENNIDFGILTDFIALKTTLKGSYNFREKAWDSAFENITKSDYTENKNGTYLEVYKNIDAKKPVNNTTEIYIPVTKKIVTRTIKRDSLATGTVNDSL